MKSRQRQNGFTLVEILVAVAIFLIVLVVIVAIFGSLHQAQLRSEAERILQENLRFTVDIMAKEIRNGQIDFGPNGYNGDTTLPKNELFLSDYSFYLNNGTVYFEPVGGEAEALTGERVEITDLRFYIHPSDLALVGQNQERVTLFIAGRDEQEEEIEMSIQTTIASRI